LNSTKFVVCLAALAIIAFKQVTSDMVMALTVVVGGYYGANGYITGRAFANGKHPNGTEK
jgi:uncharacterized protein (DUF2141 family)